jgi:hypothetical protein
MGAETSNCIALSSRGVSQRSDASARTVTDARPCGERDTIRRVANREIYTAGSGDITSGEKVQQRLIEGFGGFDVGEMSCG